MMQKRSQHTRELSRASTSILSFPDFTPFHLSDRTQTGQRFALYIFSPNCHHGRLMGLFDSIAKQVLGSAMGGQQEAATDALGGILNQVGGLEGLLGKAKDLGLDKQVSSWIGMGQNEPVESGQVEQLLGADAIQGVAEKLGFNTQQVLPLLTQFLPMIIDHLTPKGQIEQGATSTAGLDMSSILASVLKSQGGEGGLGGLLSGLMGGSKQA